MADRFRLVPVGQWPIHPRAPGRLCPPRSACPLQLNLPRASRSPPRHHPPAMALREIRYRYRYQGFAYTPPAIPDRDGHKDLISSHAVPSAPGHEGVRSNTAVQVKRRSRQTTAANKNGPPQGPIKGDLYTFRGSQAPEQGKHVPEVGLELHSLPANTGLPRKHADSGPVRHQYDPIRSPKCVLCTHARIRKFRALRPHYPSRVRLFCILRQEPSGRTSGQPQRQAPSAAAD